MKGWRKLLLVLVLLLGGLAAFVWFLPARLVAPLIQSRLQGVQLRGVGGLVWNGHADQLRLPDGSSPGRLQWQLSRRALVGMPDLTFQLDGPAARAAGHVDRERERIRWRDGHLNLRLGALARPVATPWGAPAGDVEVNLDHAVLQGGWPLSLAATAQWRNASIRSGSDDIAIGNLVAQARGDHGVIQVQLHDDGEGPLAVQASLQVSPLGWRLGADLQPRGEQPALRRWLARFGPSDAQGHVHVQRGAGLGATPLSGAF